MAELDSLMEICWSPMHWVESKRGSGRFFSCPADYPGARAAIRLHFKRTFFGIEVLSAVVVWDGEHLWAYDGRRWRPRRRKQLVSKKRWEEIKRAIVQGTLE
jgi:hypothetical protein